MKAKKLCFSSEETCSSWSHLSHFTVPMVGGLAFHLGLEIEIYCVRDFRLLYNPSFCNLKGLVLTVWFLCYLGFGIVCRKQLFQPMCNFYTAIEDTKYCTSQFIECGYKTFNKYPYEILSSWKLSINWYNKYLLVEK